MKKIEGQRKKSKKGGRNGRKEGGKIKQRKSQFKREQSGNQRLLNGVDRRFFEGELWSELFLLRSA